MQTITRRKGYKEKVSDFCDRFDNIIREHENCNPETPLSNEEKRAFYQAVCDISPQLVSTHLVRCQTEEKMTVDDMKKCLFQVTAQSTSNTEKPKAQLAQRTGGKDSAKKFYKDSEKKYKDVKCYRCNETGYY
ncbi:hypothetical protein TSAR_016014 [Trichomalopsis sarcophagae]|uniref:Uncharacterized protein n=1 Tax=Trichomalopsis sarcophagae TaxID=543379 RepID=A0A232ENJ5_9HYME|nr:hypothetical protein TSAR_016014 [Trichomalopsis sarcophagae]